MRISRDLPLAGLIALIALSVYLGTISDFLTTDSIWYADLAVNRPLSQSLHPHHLAYSPVLARVLRLFAEPSPTRDTLRLLQVANVAVSSAAVFAQFFLARTLGSSRQTAFLASALLAFANGLWSYASQIEVYNWATLCIISALIIVIRDRGHTPSGIILGPLLLAMGMLFHQTTIFFIVGIIAYSLHQYTGRDRYLFLARYACAPLFVVFLAYSLALLARTGSWSVPGLWRFVTSYSQAGIWGDASSVLLNSRNAAYGLLSSLFSITTAVARALISVLLLVAALWLGLLVRRDKISERLQLGHEQRGLLLLGVSWACFHVGFVWWWEPGNTEFWIPLLPVLSLIAIVIAKAVAPSGPLHRVGIRLLVALLFLEIAMNAPLLITQRFSVNPYMGYAQDLASHASARDVVVSIGEGSLSSYIRYFCPCSVVDLRYVSRHAEDDDTTDAIVEYLSELVTNAQGKHTVFATDQVIEGETWRFAVYELLELDVNRLRGWLALHTWQRRELRGGAVFVLVEPQVQ